MPDDSFITIALIIDPSLEFGRAVTQGIHRYVRPSKPWFVRVCPSGTTVTDWLDTLGPAGAIAHLQDRTLIERLRRSGIPAINTATSLPRAGLPTVGVNDYEVGRLAAEHLVARGYRRFGFVGQPHLYDHARREAGFRDALRRQQHRCESFAALRQAYPVKRPADWLSVLPDLESWLARLEPGTGIFAGDDGTAEDVSELCRKLALAVPHTLGLIGANNDEMRCECCHPPLSSVAVPAEAIGHEAARRLDELLDQRRQPRAMTLFAPLGVAARASTDPRPADDEVVARAIDFIHAHLDGPLNVGQLVQHVKVSRRLLEQRFAKSLGRSPLAEIRRIRIEAARRMLTETDRKIKDIAEATGFSSSEQFSTIFRRETGQSPSAFRNLRRSVTG